MMGIDQPSGLYQLVGADVCMNSLDGHSPPLVMSPQRRSEVSVSANTQREDSGLQCGDYRPVESRGSVNVNSSFN